MGSESTIQYYQENAAEYINQTINVDMHMFHERFIDLLPNSDTQHILDVGCGSGRDSYYFAKCGYKVTAFDGTSEMIRIAKNKFEYEPQGNNIQWHCITFDQVKEQSWSNKFTGVWACASLLHVPRGQLGEIFISLLNTLVEGGVLYASFKYGHSERIQNERLFCDMNEQLWSELKANLTAEFKDYVWITQDKRPERDDQWFNVLLQLQS